MRRAEYTIKITASPLGARFPMWLIPSILMHRVALALVIGGLKAAANADHNGGQPWTAHMRELFAAQPYSADLAHAG